MLLRQSLLFILPLKRFFSKIEVRDATKTAPKEQRTAGELSSVCSKSAMYN